MAQIASPASQLKVLRKTRGNLRGRATTAINEIDTLLASDPLHLEMLDQQIRRLQMLQSELNVSNNQIHLFLAGREEDEDEDDFPLNRDIQDCGTRDEAISTALIRLQQAIDHHYNPPRPPATGQPPQQQQAPTIPANQPTNVDDERLALDRLRYNLDKDRFALDSRLAAAPYNPFSAGGSLKDSLVPKYSGIPLDYQTWWTKFKALIDSRPNLSEVDKFRFLEKALDGGDAKIVLEFLTVSEETAYYAEALKMLDEFYGSKEVQIHAHNTALRTLPKLSANCKDISLIRDQITSIFAHIRTLESLGEPVDTSMHVSIVLTKLNSFVTEKINSQRDGVRWKMTDLRDALKKFITKELTKNLLHADMHNLSLCSSDGQNSSHSELSTASTLIASNKSKQNSRPAKSSAPQSNSRSARSSRQSDSTSQRQPVRPCTFCGAIHWSNDCVQYSTVAARKSRLASLQRCFRCLNEGHTEPKCTRRVRPCFYCRSSSHHSTLCPDKSGSTSVASPAISVEAADTPPESAQRLTAVAHGAGVVLQTALVVVFSTPHFDRKITVRILIDPGSTHSYITCALAKLLRAQLSSPYAMNTASFLEVNCRSHRARKTVVSLLCKDGTTHELFVDVVPNITATITRAGFPQSVVDFLESSSLELADTIPKVDEPTTIDFLLGADYCEDFKLTGKQRVGPNNGLWLLDSRFGWLVCGRTGKNDSVSAPRYGLVNAASPTTDLPDFEACWSLHDIGIKDDAHVSDDESAVQHFYRHANFRNDRWEVGFPWRPDKFVLHDNFDLALGRLRSLVKRFATEPHLHVVYNDTIRDQLSRGIIEPVTESTKSGEQMYYVPHHPHVKSASVTTKVRIVYDASSSLRATWKSLNDCVLQGPNMLEDLVGLLLRFRLWKYAIAADIEKAYLMVGLLESDRDATRFLYLRDPTNLSIENNIQTYRFCRVPFGVKCSAFLLAKTIDHHLEQYQTATASDIRGNVYVDNLGTGRNSVADAITFYRETKAIFQANSMNMREWVSNSPEFISSIPEVDRAKKTETMKILGVKWNIARDEFSFCSPDSIDMSVCSKVSILRAAGQVYDPLGLLSPLTVRCRLLLQRAWKTSCGWKDDLPPDIHKDWQVLATELMRIPSLSISRIIGFPGDTCSYQLIGFCDASILAYAGPVYLRSETTDGRVKLDLIFAKSRVTPTKPITIPRLELISAVIGKRALIYVKKQMRLPIESMTLFCDSQCVLQWIQSAKRHSVFVENRLKELLAAASEHHLTFQYIPTKLNPADIPSRGASFDELRDSSLWWNGPELLRGPQSTWSHGSIPPITPELLEQIELESRPVPQVLTLLSADEPTSPDFLCGIDLNRFSNFNRLVRTLCYVRRSFRNDPTFKFPISAEELDHAQLLLEKNLQQIAFPDVFAAISCDSTHSLKDQLRVYVSPDGRLRCQGRIDKSTTLPDSAKRPVLLPRRSQYTKLFILRIHRDNFHSGVSHTISLIRQTHWIPAIRPYVRSVLHSCRVCAKHNTGPYVQPFVPQLPESRVSRTIAFAHVGIDYFGPLLITSSAGDSTVKKKVWVLIVVCMAVRAIHIEVVNDMTTHCFLLAFRRFVATRGCPSSILSDNAKTFKLAEETIDLAFKNLLLHDDVQTYFATTGITWRFIPDLAPWFGGSYERLVGVIKQSLRRTLGKQCYTHDNLSTLLFEAAAIVNSRPLVYIPASSPATDVIITPAHFLVVNPRCGLPLRADPDRDDPDYIPAVQSSADILLKSWRAGIDLLDKFWGIFANDYLLSLRERFQHNANNSRSAVHRQPAIGDIVLIWDSMRPRGSWQLGAVIQLHASTDDAIRHVSIRLANRTIIRRSVAQCYPIECPCAKLDEESQMQQSNPVVDPDEPPTTTRRRPQRESATKASRQIHQYYKDMSATSP